MRLLEMVATETPLPAILRRLALLVEDHCEGAVCGIMRVSDDGGHLHPLAAPSLPVDYLAAIDGVAVGARVGSCGTAVHRREPVYVVDIATDPLWAELRGARARARAARVLVGAGARRRRHRSGHDRPLLRRAARPVRRRHPRHRAGGLDRPARDRARAGPGGAARERAQARRRPRPHAARRGRGAGAHRGRPARRHDPGADRQPALHRPRPPRRPGERDRRPHRADRRPRPPGVDARSHEAADVRDPAAAARVARARARRWRAARPDPARHGDSGRRHDRRRPALAEHRVARLPHGAGARRERPQACARDPARGRADGRRRPPPGYGRRRRMRVRHDACARPQRDAASPRTCRRWRSACGLREATSRSRAAPAAARRRASASRSN